MLKIKDVRQRQVVLQSRITAWDELVEKVQGLALSGDVVPGLLGDIEVRTESWEKFLNNLRIMWRVERATCRHIRCMNINHNGKRGYAYHEFGDIKVGYIFDHRNPPEQLGLDGCQLADVEVLTSYKRWVCTANG